MNNEKLRCPKCGRDDLTEGDFFPSQLRKGCWCKRCFNLKNAVRRRVHPEKQRAYSMKHLYGISQQEFAEMLERQQGNCLICGVRLSTLKDGGGDRSRHVDHDHETGVVRGFLCMACNTGLGKFKHDPEVLRVAAAYVQVWKTGDPAAFNFLVTLQRRRGM